MTWLIIISFLLVPICVSVISTIHVINFFSLSNGFGLALTLAIAFEIGALSALAGLVALGKINKNVVWFIFILLTIFQVNGNTYYAYDVLTQKMVIEPNLVKNWAELFGLVDEDPIFIKRIIALISGGILPIVSLAFLDLLVDYIRKTFGIEDQEKSKQVTTNELTEEQLHELSRLAGQIEKQNVDSEPQPKYENLDKIEEYLTNLKPKEEVSVPIQEPIEEQTPNEEVVVKNNEEEPIKRIVYHRQNG